MNFNRLPQDHPCVINYLRRHVLKAPASPHLPLKLDYPELNDPSMGQPNEILDIMRRQVYLYLQIKRFMHTIYLIYVYSFLSI